MQVGPRERGEPPDGDDQVQRIGAPLPSRGVIHVKRPVHATGSGDVLFQWEKSFLYADDLALPGASVVRIDWGAGQKVVVLEQLDDVHAPEVTGLVDVLVAIGLPAQRIHA